MVSGKYDLNDNLNDNWSDHREREREGDSTIPFNY